MSEFINNSEERKEKLKAIIQSYNERLIDNKLVVKWWKRKRSYS